MAEQLKHERVYILTGDDRGHRSGDAISGRDAEAAGIDPSKLRPMTEAEASKRWQRAT